MTFLGCFGLTMFLTTGILEIKNYNMFCDYYFEMGIAPIIFLFFIALGTYSWVSFFNNIVMKPKEKILFLLRKKEYKSIKEISKDLIFYKKMI